MIARIGVRMSIDQLVHHHWATIGDHYDRSMSPVPRPFNFAIQIQRVTDPTLLTCIVCRRVALLEAVVVVYMRRLLP